jgi:FixJ family two-component response regulator
MASIPVIVVSGHPNLKVATRTMSARAVLAKPVEFGRLLRAMDEHCAEADREAGALRLRLLRTHPWSSASARRN